MLLAWEEKRTKQRRPHGPARMEPHQIAWSTRPTRAQRRRRRRGEAASFGRTRNGGWRRQEQAGYGVTSDERQESSGKGGGCSDNVGGDVVARGGGRQLTTRGEQAADNATHGRRRTTTASNKSGCRTMGWRHSSKINKHKVLNLSPFAVIFDNAERTQHLPRCGEGVYRAGTCADGS